MVFECHFRNVSLLTASLLWTACGSNNGATGSNGSSGGSSSIPGTSSGGNSSVAGATGNGGPSSSSSPGSGGTNTAGAAGSTGNDVAPALDRTVATNFSDAFGFIYQGPNATQVGVQDGAIDARRLVVVRGRVVDGSAAPVAQAVVASPEHPEYGHTLTRADGTFDMVVNGGGAVRLNVAASGYLGVERELRPEWRSFEPLTDILLTKLDSKVTEVTLGESATQQLAQGTVASDRSGARTSSLVFGAGTSANLVFADGSKQPLSTAHVRITEYTVGDNGPKAMPAQLPPQSGYTYAVELSVDEATTAGATGVEFSKPVPYYVDNFLNFPVGEPVPAGYYDRAQGQWVPAPSGRVIAMVDVQNGSALLDVDGDGAADDPAKLTALGITSDELATLGSSYTKGKSLWRVPISHFSTWDFNWCFFGRLFDALADLAPNHDALDDDCIASGSLIECQNQILGESLKLTGLPSSLNYRSDRVPGRREAYQVDVQLTGSEAPPEAKRVRFELEILGQHVTYHADAAPNLAYHYVWDGKDGYGRVWQGPAPIRYRVGYVYDGWYGHTEVFGDYGQVDATRWSPAPDSGAARSNGVTPEDDLPRRETTMWLPWQKSTVGSFDSSQLGFGGFTLSEHHTYDPESRTLYLGTGDRRHAGSSRDVVRALIGAVGGTSDESGEPRRTELDAPHGLVVAPDGTIYLAVENQNRVLKLGTNNKVVVVAGTGNSGYSGDGGPATDAELSQPLGLALSKDGSLYICERGNSVVRRITPAGIIETVAGSKARTTSNGDGGSATDARLGEPHSVAIGLDGSLFIVDATNHNVRRVRPDKIIETVLGSPSGLPGSTGDGGPGTQAFLNNPLGIAVGSDGSLYITEYEGNRVRRLAPDGTTSTVGGIGTAGDSGDEGPATEAQLSNPHSVDVAPDGSLYITDEGNDRVRMVTPDGIIHALTGGGGQEPNEYIPAQDAEFLTPRLVNVEPSGRVLIADYSADIVYRLVPFLPSTDPNGYTIAADDGLSYYVFDRSGRHLNTVDSITGQTLLSFDYDAAGRLSLTHDSNDRVTSIERDATTGRAIKITSPDGLGSALHYATSGWLSSVTNPAGETHQFVLSDQGLLTQETDIAGRQHNFEYDTTGRLTKDIEASGSYQTLLRADDQSTVTRTTARGLAYVYQRSIGKDGTEQRTATLPDGRAVTTNATPGHSVTQRADGTKVETTFASDPRFGLVAKYPASVTVTTPSGLAAQVTSSRTIELVDQNDPSNLKSYRIRTDLNNRPLVDERFDMATLTRTTEARGVTTTTKFDDHGRVIEIDPPAKHLPIQISYDSVGRLSQISQGSRVWNALGYDTYGFLASSTDALGTTTNYAHDLAGRILSIEQAAADIQFTYKTGDLTALLTPTGSSHGFGYDSAGRNVLYAAPLVTATSATDTTYSYGVDDALEAITLPSGRKLERTINAQGRVTNWKTPEAAVTATYDNTSGNIASLQTEGEAIAYTWDGSLLLSSTWSGTVAGKVSWTYDNAFRPVSETVGTSTVALDYNSYGRLNKVGPEAIYYLADGRSIDSTYCNHVTETFSYSSDLGELSRQVVTGNGTPYTLYQADFTRDALGRIVTKDETVRGTKASESYTYDALGRLTSVTRDTATAQYTYDPNGNRTDSGAQVDAQDRLLQLNGISYTYDDDGQLKTRTANGETTTYTYDTLGQLRSVALPSHRVDYLIDPAGRRMGKQVDGLFTKGFNYDAQGRVLAELDSAGNLVSQFAYGTHRNVPDLMMQGGKTYRLVSDYLGSVRLVVDTETSDVAQQIDYNVWGNVTSDTNPGFQPFGFAGGIYDMDTGLVRFGARDYDPMVGRWTSKDPILFGGGQANVFVYVNSEPVNSLDPSGLDVWIEGPSDGEPAGHLSLAVGDSNGYYRSFAYGMDTPATFAWPAGVHGSVYEDTRLGGTVQSYMKTSSAEDQEIIQNLKWLVGGPNPFTSNGACYTFGNTCRDFTREVWAAIRDSGAGTLVNPPATIRDNSTGSGVPWLSSACQN